MRTFEVLELFAEKRRPLQLIEIYTSLGYPQSSSTNLLKSMVMLGYLNYNRTTRTYVPTMKISMLGSWVGRYIQADGGFRWLVDEAVRRTNETVALNTQNDLFNQYLFLKTPDHAFVMPPQDGAMRLMVDSVGGRALLSRMHDREVDKIVRYANYYRDDDEAPIVFDDFIKEINWIRLTGYAYVQHRPTPEVSAIAIALDTDLHGIPLALGVGGMHDRIHPRQMELVKILRDLIAEFQDRMTRGDPAAFPPPPVA